MIYKGCYHNQTIIGLLPLICKKHDIDLLRYDFSEAQAGKGICDRKIAVIKRLMLDHVTNTGKDISSANDMLKAIEDSRNLNGVFVSLNQIIKEIDFNNIIKIPNITTYSSFKYTISSVLFYRNYGIGNGETKTLASLYKLPTKSNASSQIEFEKMVVNKIKNHIIKRLNYSSG